MLVDKQSELMSDLLFAVHQHGGDDVTGKPPIETKMSPLISQMLAFLSTLFIVTMASDFSFQSFNAGKL